MAPSVLTNLNLVLLVGAGNVQQGVGYMPVVVSISGMGAPAYFSPASIPA